MEKKPPPWRRENLWMQYKSLTLESRKSVLREGGCEVGSGDFDTHMSGLNLGTIKTMTPL
jgi:hypothetical protein